MLLPVAGVTGTRGSITQAQIDWLWQVLRGRAGLHHGACTGADFAAHLIALEAGVPASNITAHPMSDSTFRMPFDPRINWADPLPPLKRNHALVDASVELFAVPDGRERLRSGTWATVRYAVKTAHPVMICYPDGTLEPR